MKKIQFKMENCFGIGFLDETFSFEYKNIIGIYARNGVMKTSFSKTLSLLSTGKESEIKDHIYNKEPSVSIKIDDEDITEYKNIYVIESLKDKFLYNEENISALLVNEELKEKYEKISNEIESRKQKLIKILSKKSGNGTTTESIFNKDFDKQDIYKNLCSIYDEGIEHSGVYSEFKYKDVFNADTEDVLESAETKTILREFFNKLQEIINSKEFFSIDGFDPTKARIVFDAMEKQSFFNPENSINLLGEKSPLNKASFEKVINDIEAEISTSSELKDLAAKIAKKVGGRDFQALILKNPIIIDTLSKMGTSGFKKDIWKYYLKEEKESLESFVEYYRKNKGSLEEIEKHATEQVPLWDETIKTFKDRFKPKFKINLDKKESAILGQVVPVVVFEFGNENMKFTKDEL